MLAVKAKVNLAHGPFILLITIFIFIPTAHLSELFIFSLARLSLRVAKKSAYWLECGRLA
jgi:hypothetical protein